MDWWGYIAICLYLGLVAFLIGMFVRHCGRQEENHEIVIKKLDAIMKKLIDDKR